MTTTDPRDAARVELIMAELRLPAIRRLWAGLAGRRRAAEAKTVARRGIRALEARAFGTGAGSTTMTRGGSGHARPR